MCRLKLALLYDFLNTLDERRYMENGALHNGGDEISTSLLRAEWMRARSLLGADARPAHSAQVQSNGLYRLRLRDVKMATSDRKLFLQTLFKLEEFRRIATCYEKTDQTAARRSTSSDPRSLTDECPQAQISAAQRFFTGDH